MALDILHSFISPITGKIPIFKDYILVGDEQNFSIMSPKLIDIELDLINVRKNLDDLLSASFIISTANSQLPNSQALTPLDNGFLITTNGILSTSSNIILPSLEQGNIWIGNDENVATAQPIININNLPNLSAKAFWQGNGADISRPIEFLFSSLGEGILKVDSEGNLTLAIAGIDYPTIESVALAQATADAAAAAAAAAPAEGAALAAIYFNAQMLPYSAIPGITAGFSISAALGVVTASAAAAQSTANNAVNLINTVEIKGDVTGVNDSNTNIITSTFAPNPVFTGNEAMTIPSGFTAQRPLNTVSGMLRFNKE